MSGYIYTIGREFGSGGMLVGHMLADKLNIPFYDKELLQKAAKESGFCEEILENHDEKPTSSFLYSLVMDTYSGGSYSSAPFLDMPYCCSSGIYGCVFSRALCPLFKAGLCCQRRTLPEEHCHY